MEVNKLTNTQKAVSWVFQLLAAVLFFQTLFFKFSGAPESIYIFETIGFEPLGRYVSGIAELFVVILLLWPRRAWAGALLGFIVISGAIFFHLTILGIEVQGDKGTLFIMALVVFTSCLIVLYIQRKRMVGDLQSLLHGEQPEMDDRNPLS